LAIMNLFFYFLSLKENKRITLVLHISIQLFSTAVTINKKEAE
jgi:hypothetical protein